MSLGSYIHPSLLNILHKIFNKGPYDTTRQQMDLFKLPNQCCSVIAILRCDEFFMDVNVHHE